MEGEVKSECVLSITEVSDKHMNKSKGHHVGNVNGKGKNDLPKRDAQKECSSPVPTTRVSCLPSLSSESMRSLGCTYGSEALEADVAGSLSKNQPE